MRAHASPPFSTKDWLARGGSGGLMTAGSLVHPPDDDGTAGVDRDHGAIGDELEVRERSDDARDVLFRHGIAARPVADRLHLQLSIDDEAPPPRLPGVLPAPRLPGEQHMTAPVHLDALG